MRNLKKAAMPALAVCLIIFTACLRAARRYDNQLILAVQELVIFYIYIGMIAAWGVSVRRRIMHRPIKRYLLLTVLCMLLWVFARTCKNQFFCNIEPWGNRFWYMYYIPMILIPLLGFFIAVHIGKRENWKLQKRYLLLFVPAVLLIAGILTNELHGMAFEIFQNSNGETDYIRGPLYYAAAVWMLVMFLLCIGVLWYKCRLPHAVKRVWQPLAVVGVGVLYCILYWIDCSHSGFGFIEMTVAYCAVTAAIWESCIAVGLIPSNTKYRAFFNFSDIGAQIVNENGGRLFFSKTAREISQDTFERLKTETVPVQGGDAALHMKALSHGYVIWQEDLSVINRSIHELQRIEKELKDGAELLKEEFTERSQKLRVQEQIRIYNKLSAHTERQLGKIEQLLEQMKTADSSAARRILSEINVLGAYIKRRSNLIFISESQKNIPMEELVRCFEESIENLRVFGADCAFSAADGEALSCEYAMLIYDLFEEVTENVMSSLQTLLAAVSRRGSCLRFRVRFQCDEMPVEFCCSQRLSEEVQNADGQIFYECEDDTACVTLSLPERSGVQ